MVPPYMIERSDDSLEVMSEVVKVGIFSLDWQVPLPDPSQLGQSDQPESRPPAEYEGTDVFVEIPFSQIMLPQEVAGLQGTWGADSERIDGLTGITASPTSLGYNTTPTDPKQSTTPVSSSPFTGESRPRRELRTSLNLSEDVSASVGSGCQRCLASGKDVE